ncbi:MAG TPA: carboxypeptidase-like regulatory domain-containing protein [Edaphobacter sp.]
MFLLFACVVTHAQQNSIITGTVTDNEGAAIPGAQVSVTADATGFVNNTVTNSAGIYSMPALNVGTYGLRVSMKGFQTYVAKGLAVNVSQTLRADVVLSVGSVSETVTVSANALTVQADSNVVSSLISAEQISEIATQNRNFAALAAIGLGASSMMPDNNTPSAGAGGSNFNISINGLRQSHNIWLIDGGESDDRGGAGGMQIMPSQDSIAQFETLSSNYPPDYGISSGATISLGLKSGTRSFHGSLWEFNRNTAYDANYFLNKQSNTKRPVLNYNIYGFNVGGPVMIPGLYNKDRSKTFFFWNEEWRKIKQGNSPNIVKTLPAADFPTAGQNLKYVAPGFASDSAILVPSASSVGDPAYAAKLASLGLTAGQPFPNNTIPAALLDPNAVAYLNSGIVPKPNRSDDQISTSAQTPLTVRDDVVRVDHRINDKWQILAHYLHDSVTQAQGGPMVGWSGASYNTITSTIVTPSNSGALKLTGSITPNLLAEVSINYDGNQIDIVNSPNSLLTSGFSVNRFFNNKSKNMPNMHWNGQYGTQENPASGPWHNAAQDYSPKVDVSYLSGKHSMKFGFSYNRYTKNQQLFGNWGGEFFFDNITGGTIGTTKYSGDPFMDMLLGFSSKYSQAQDLPIRHYVNQTTSVYAMDNWKVTQRLSLQLGLRYDALPSAWERGNNVANFDPNLYISSLAPTYIPGSSSLDSTGPGFSAVNGQLFYLNGIYIAGQNGEPKGLSRNDYGTLQPRVGFSEDLFGTGKTILRGGIGSFYERMQGNDIYDVAPSVPFSNTPSASNVYLANPGTSYVTGATAALPFGPQGLTTLSRTFQAPGVAQFSLGVQHEIRPSVVAVVQYVGNLAWHQNIRRQINTYPLSTPMNIRANAGDSSNNSGTNPAHASLSNGDSYRTYRGYNTINQQENTTNGNYNGFQVGLRAQGWRGLSGEVDYTWSHEIDLTSFDDNGISNPWNLKYDKGSGAFDRRHILNMNYIYKLPIFTNPGLMHTVLGGWEIAGTAVFQSGAIIANQGPGLSVGYDPVGLGGGYTNRPNIVGKVHYTKTQKQWFDPSAFTAPTPAWAGGANQGFGNARKDSVIGPGRVNFNTSIYKSFAIAERAHFELRAESFNTFNHTQFNGIGNSFQGFSGGASKGNFGQVTSTFDPRTLELGGKLIF